MGRHENPGRTDKTAYANGRDYTGAPPQIDATTEELFSLSEAAKLVPKLNARRVHASTVLRWCRRGLRGVRLGYVRIGRRMATSAEALNRFFNALAEADGEAEDRADSEAPERHQKRWPVPAVRARAVSEAAAELERAGL